MAFLKEDSSVIMAARVGKMFQLDPIAILDDGGDDLINAVRLAAAQIVQDDEKKQADQQRAASRPRRR